MRDYMILAEEFANSFRYHRLGKPLECTVFKNPTRKEWREAEGQFPGQVRGYIVGDDLFIWDAYNTVHRDVRDAMGFDPNTAVPVYIYGKLGDEVSFVVSDACENTPLWHNPQIDEMIYTSSFVKKSFTDLDIDYYDSAIVGPWGAL